MRIRPYAESDEQAVVRLWQEVFAGAPARNDPAVNIRRKLDVQRELFLVAEANGRVVGTAMGGYDGHRGWVYYLAVAPGCRRQGIGRALMQRLEADLSAMGCPKLNLMVRRSNAGVLPFYESLGYKEEEIVHMGKELEAPHCLGASSRPPTTTTDSASAHGTIS